MILSRFRELQVDLGRVSDDLSLADAPAGDGGAELRVVEEEIEPASEDARWRCALVDKIVFENLFDQVAQTKVGIELVGALEVPDDTLADFAGDIFLVVVVEGVVGPEFLEADCTHDLPEF